MRYTFYIYTYNYIIVLYYNNDFFNVKSSTLVLYLLLINTYNDINYNKCL